MVRAVQSILDRPDRWPFEPTGFVFLAREIHEQAAKVAEAGGADARYQAALTLRRELADGNRESFVLTHDGEMVALRKTLWNVEETFRRFVLFGEAGTFDVYPNAHPLAGLSKYPIFLPRAAPSTPKPAFTEALAEAFFRHEILATWRAHSRRREYQVNRDLLGELIAWRFDLEPGAFNRDLPRRIIADWHPGDEGWTLKPGNVQMQNFETWQELLKTYKNQRVAEQNV